MIVAFPVHTHLLSKDLKFDPSLYEALPGVLWNTGKRVFISGEQGNKGQILRRTGEQRQYWGTGNIRKQISNFGEQGNKPFFSGEQGNRYPPGRFSFIFIHILYMGEAKVLASLHICTELHEPSLLAYETHGQQTICWLICLITFYSNYQ